MSEIAEMPLPCPFCGSEASAVGTVKYYEKTVADQEWGQDEFYFCNCPSCGVSNVGLVGHRTKAAAIVHWNKRTAASHIEAQDARIERLEKALKDAVDEATAGIAYESMPIGFKEYKSHDELPNGLRTSGHIKMSMIREKARAALENKP